MTSLKARLMKALEFDVKRAVESSREPYNANPSDNMFIGIKRESDRLNPIHLALADVVEALHDALDAIDMGLGLLPSSPETQKLISAQAKLEEALKEVE